MGQGAVRKGGRVTHFYHRNGVMFSNFQSLCQVRKLVAKTAGANVASDFIIKTVLTEVENPALNGDHDTKVDLNFCTIGLGIPGCMEEINYLRCRH